MIDVPSKNMLLFLQPLSPALPTLPGLTTGNGNDRDRSSSHAIRNHTTPHAIV